MAKIYGKVKAMNIDEKQKGLMDKYILGFLILYTGILFIISFSRIFDNAFWGDECYSIKLIKMGFGEMLEGTGADVHPPLYYIILRIACSILGKKGFIFHLVSIIPVGLTFLFCVTKVYKKFGSYASFLLATFIFFLDSAVIYSVEVRMYSWANFFVLMSFYEMHEIIVKNEKRDWMLFSFFSLAAAYTHYYALIAVAFLYAMLIVYEIWKKGHTWKRTMTVCLVAVIVYLPWLLNLLQAFGRTSNGWWLQENPKISECIKYLFSMKITQVSWLYVGVLGISILILFYNTYIRKKVNYEFTFWILAGVISILGTICFGQIISIIWCPMFQTKYVYVVAGIAWIMLGIVLEQLQGKKVWFVGILAITLVVGIPNYCRRVEKDKECQSSMQIVLDSTKDMKNTDILGTNSSHLNWTILEYYFPNNEHVWAGNRVEDIEESNIKWLFWESELGNMKEHKVAEGYMGPYDYVYVYKIE